MSSNRTEHKTVQTRQIRTLVTVHQIEEAVEGALGHLQVDAPLLATIVTVDCTPRLRVAEDARGHAERPWTPDGALRHYMQ